MVQHCTELFRNESGVVYQDNRGRGFWLEWNGETTLFRYPCFQSLRRKVSEIDWDCMLNDAGRHADYTIISPCGCERCFVLTLAEAWALQELLAGAQVMLSLHSIVQDRLYSFSLV